MYSSDPEKIKLLKQKNKGGKKKHSESRSKMTQELYGSSSTERFQQPKRKSSTAVQNKERFEYDRRDVFENQGHKLKKSPSRVSCALKKLIGSEYACAGCFALIFLVTIAGGLLLVFKVMSTSSDTMVDDSMKVPSAKEKRQSDEYDVFGGRRYREKYFDDGYQLPTYSVATDRNEFAYTDLSEQSSKDDLSNVINGAEIMDSDNEKLREFYKKLIETDAEIKIVKQNLKTNIRKYDKDEFRRIKRTLKKTQFDAINQKLRQGNITLTSTLRNKRLNNNTKDGYGIIIQEQEVIIYEPKISKNTKDRKVFKQHYKNAFYKRKQKNDKENDELKTNFRVIKEDKRPFNNTNISATKHDKDEILSTVQKDSNISVPFNLKNDDMIYLPYFESLNFLSNITINKGDSISKESKNVNHRRRNIYTDNGKYEGKRPKDLSRKGRSLMSLEGKRLIDTKTAGVDKNHHNHTNETNIDTSRSKRLFQYYTSEYNFVSTSKLAQFDKAFATQGTSIVDDLKERTKKESAHNANRISRHIEGHETNFTTISLTNRSQVKREVDNELVFGNRVYNDKYTLKNDLDDKKRGSAKKSKIQKSKDLLTSKINFMGRRKKADKIKKDANNCFSTKALNIERPYRGRPNWRKIRTLQHVKNNDEQDMDYIFKTLNAKMETICREAAFAIQTTKNVKVRESKADIATSTLMQRLVRMMRDLVDMQVQEKTCVELPPDLRQFLEWLVPPSEANPQADDLNPDISDYIAAKREFDGIDQSNDVPDQPLSLAENFDQAEVDKIRCKETIHAVQDLVDQYEGLSSDDKYKLSGVRDYLQRQLQYLNKLAGDIDTENNYYQETEDRVKRDTNKNKRMLAPKKSNSRFSYFMQRMKHTTATTQAIDQSSRNNAIVKDKEGINFTSQEQTSISDVYNRPQEEVNITIT